ncbi:MAG: hypothetical protein AB7O49_05330 [Sphingomonadales bacterium]
MLRLTLFLVVLSAAALSPASAEIVKTADASCREGAICFRWWPKLPDLAGWHSDDATNKTYGASILLPEGSTFADAPALIYGAATSKSKSEDVRSVADYIRKDTDGFREHDPGLRITEVDPLVTADGQSLRCFTFFPSGEGNWEKVAYGEEDDFFLVFTVSGRTEKDYTEALPTFDGMVKAYRR